MRRQTDAAKGGTLSVPLLCVNAIPPAVGLFSLPLRCVSYAMRVVFERNAVKMFTSPVKSNQGGFEMQFLDKRRRNV